MLVTRKKDIFRFSATDAMWCLSPFNPVRRIAIAILTHGMFSLIIITTILANCYVMIIPPSPVTESTELVFFTKDEMLNIHLFIIKNYLKYFINYVCILF